MAEDNSSQQNTYRGVITNFNLGTGDDSYEERSHGVYKVNMVFRPTDPSLQGFVVPIFYRTESKDMQILLAQALRRSYQAGEYEKGKDIPVEVVLDKPISQETDSYMVKGLVRILAE